MLHDVEHGERCDALSIRRKLEDSPSSIGGGDRLDPLRLKVAEVFKRMDSTVCVEKFDHRLRHGSVVEGVSTMCSNLAKGIGERGIFEEIARFRSVRPDNVGLFIAGLIKQSLRDPIAGIALSERKSVLRVVDSGCE